MPARCAVCARHPSGPHIASMIDAAAAALLALAVLGSGALASDGYYTTSVSDHNHIYERKHDKYVACYYQNWAIYRNGDGDFKIIDDMKQEYCTHVIYAFAGLNDTTFQLQSLDPWADLEIHNGKNGYKQMLNLRYKHPNSGLKVLLALGGWNEGSRKYSIMANSQYSRSIFIKSAVQFLRSYNFDGLDLDWEYPGLRGGEFYDKSNLVTLLKEMKEAFRQNNLLLTAAVPANIGKLREQYSIGRMAEYLDYIHLMTYDYHTLEDQIVLPNSPIDEVNDTLNYLLYAEYVRPRKIIMGLPTYGRGYVLTEPLRSPAESPIGKKSLPTSWTGFYNNQEGTFGYNEICKYYLGNTSWTQRWDNMSYTPYLTHEYRVIVYDNPKSLQAKVRLAMDRGLGGVFVWSIDTDDFRGKCRYEHKHHHRYNRVDVDDHSYPLMQAINYALEKGSSSQAVANPVSVIILLLFAVASLLQSL